MIPTATGENTLINFGYTQIKFSNENPNKFFKTQKIPNQLPLTKSYSEEKPLKETASTYYKQMRMDPKISMGSPTNPKTFSTY